MSPLLAAASCPAFAPEPPLRAPDVQPRLQVERSAPVVSATPTKPRSA